MWLELRIKIPLIIFQSHKIMEYTYIYEPQTKLVSFVFNLSYFFTRRLLQKVYNLFFKINGILRKQTYD